MSRAADARRRWFGCFFLITAVGLLIWGETILKPYLSGLVFVLYWLLCFGMTGLAILTAWLDIRAIRRRTRAEQEALLARSLQAIERDSSQLKSKSSEKEPDPNPAGSDRSGNAKSPGS